MFIDVLGKLVESQVVSAPANFANVIDLGGPHAGIGEGLALVVFVETDLAAAGVVEVTSDSVNTGLGTKHFDMHIPATAKAGDKFVQTLPADKSLKQYLSGAFSGTTAGTFSVQLIPANMVDAYVQYDDNITIS